MAFPDSIDSFITHTEILAADVPYVERFQTLKLKANRTPDEENEMASLLTRLRSKFISSEDFNKFQEALVNMQVFIRDNVVGYINTMKTEVDTAKDQALIAIEQKKNGVIDYLDGTEAGEMRNDIGVMADLTTIEKDSLVLAINEVNAKSPADASITQKGIVQLSNSTSSTSETQAATSKALKTTYDLANSKESPSGAQAKADVVKNYVDNLTWQRTKVTANDGTAVLISSQDIHQIQQTGFYMGSNVINAPTADWFFFEVNRHNNQYATINAYPLSAGATTTYGLRQKRQIGGSWGPWSDDLFQSGVDAKQGIVDAINAMGGSASTNDTWAVLSSKIRAIKTGKKYVAGTFLTDNLGRGSVSGLEFMPRNIIITNGAYNGLSLIHI